MTKDRALRVLDVYASVNGSGQCTQDEFEEAKKMAIEALESQDRQVIIAGSYLLEGEDNVPDTNVGDIISRQAAIDALRAMQTYKLFAGDDQLLIDQAGAQTELMMLPSAQPEKVCIANITLSEEQLREAVEKALESKLYRENVRATLRDDHGSYRCTNCNALISDEIDYVLEDYKPIQFCPNCGAQMIGDKE